MGKLIMPKHTGELVYFQTPLKVYYDAGSWLSMRDFCDKLFDELVALGKETSRNSDNTHYTKCAQLPRYLGFVTRKENKRDADAKITSTGKLFYEALKNGDVDTEHRLIIEAFENLTFGRDTEGCGSDSDVEPIGVFFRAVYSLNGVTGKEYGYILGELDEKGRNLEEVLEDVRAFRARGIPPPIASNTIASNLSDCKTMKLMKELGVIVEDGTARMIVAPRVDSVYRNRLLALKTTNTPPLKKPFKQWLTEKGFGVSVESYPRSIEAISMPLSTPMSKTTGSWEGVYEYVIGARPKMNTFSVTSRHCFDSVYAKFSRLLSKQVSPPFEDIDPARHQELIDYTLKSGESTDKGRLYCAYNAYKDFLKWFDLNKGSLGFCETKGEVMDNRVLSAIRTKPFILLAGISGTGKSRMVRQLARGCCPRHKEGSTTEDHPLYNEQKPGNFEMIPVRPNWHDSTELMGYVTRISSDNKPKYVLTPFVHFLVKAWLHPDVPFFLCLDEMNLAPVEQYFAEYLSAIESRKKDSSGKINTDVLVRFDVAQIDDDTNKFVKATVDALLKDYKPAAGSPVDAVVTDLERKMIEDKGLRIPPNLVVMGTVNMDETTCTFSRKVLDRAMSFELNDVSDMYAPDKLVGEGDYEFESIDADAAKGTLLTGKEAYDSAGGQGVAITAASGNTKVGDAVLAFLENLNEKEMPAKKADGSDGEGNMSLLAKTPFKIAYRSRNEIMVYCIERIAGNIVPLPQALDEALSMKVLSRIEGDSQHVRPEWLQTLSAAIVDGLSKLDGYDADKCVVCKDKLADMVEQAQYGYTSFWMR